MGNTDIIHSVRNPYGWLADYGRDAVPEDEGWTIAQDNAPDIAADILAHCCAGEFVYWQKVTGPRYAC
jgi:hypothetical protein